MTRKQRETEERVGVPAVGEVYQEMTKTKKMEDEVAKKERKRGEKEHSHQEYEKVKEYEKHLPTMEKRTATERPPFKKK